MLDRMMEVVKVVIHTPVRSSPIFILKLQLILAKARFSLYPRSVVAVAITVASRSISTWARPSVSVLRVGCSVTIQNPASVSTTMIYRHFHYYMQIWNKITLNFSGWRFQGWSSNVHDPTCSCNHWLAYYYWNLPNILYVHKNFEFYNITD